MALVIGIDDYQNLSKLGGAVRDAKNVATALRERGMEVTMLINHSATRERITRILGDNFPNQILDPTWTTPDFEGNV